MESTEKNYFEQFINMEPSNCDILKKNLLIFKY